MTADHDGFDRTGNGSREGASSLNGTSALREETRFMLPAEVDHDGLHQAESAKRAMHDQESYHGAQLETLDKLISGEREFLRSRLHRDKQGVQRVVSQALEYVGFGYSYQSKRKVAAVHAMTDSVGAVVKLLTDTCQSYAQEMREMNQGYVRDRKLLALNKKILDEKSKVSAQHRTEIETMERDASFSDSSTVREMDLRCKVIDLDNDIAMLHTENDSVAIRLMAADDLLVSTQQAYDGTSRLLADVAKQRANLAASSRKADLYAKIQGTGGQQSIHLLYLNAAKAVKSMEQLLGNGPEQVFRELPAEGRITPVPAKQYRGQGNANVRLWQSYWHNTFEKGKR